MKEIDLENVSGRFGLREISKPGISIFGIQLFWDNRREGTIAVWTNINARGRGDEALALLAERLNSVARETGLEFVHEGVPSGSGEEAMTALFERTLGYKKSVSTDGETVVYEKWFRG